MKAIILARVSTKEQEEEGHSIPSQVRRLTEYAKHKGLDVIKVFQIAESSTKDTRKEFENILDLIKNSNEITALIIDTVDRLQRSFRESVIMDEYRRAGKVELHFFRENLIINKDSNSADILRWDMGVMFAKSYVLQLSDNVKRSFEQKRRDGQWIGKAPIGYLNIEENGKRDIILDPAKSHFVKKMFELYAQSNCSIKMLAQEMEKLGLKSDQGTPLSPSNVHATLKNPFYHGTMRSNGKEYPHKYAPLVSFQLFQQARMVMDGYHKKPFQYAAKPFILRGLMTCNKCGCTITPEIKKGKYVYYSCTNYKGLCKRVWVKQEDMLKPIYDTLKRLQMPQERINEVIEGVRSLSDSKNRYHIESLRQLQTQYQKLQTRIDNLLDARLDGSITKDMYDEKLKKLKEEQMDVVMQIEDHTKADENWYLTASRVLDIAQRAVEIFDRSEPNEKRQFLNYLLQNCRLSGKNLVFDLRKPFDSIALYANHPTDLPLYNEIRTHFEQNPDAN